MWVKPWNNAAAGKAKRSAGLDPLNLKGYRMLTQPRRIRTIQLAFALVLTFFIQQGAARSILGQTPLDSGKSDELGAVVLLGEEIVRTTTKHAMSRNFVGNALNCTSCHLSNGRHPSAGTFLGTATAYPAWSPREKRVITLEDRVLNCFMRSCNGTRPPLGSEVSVAVTAYITSLSQDLPIQMNRVRPVGPGAIKPLAIKSSQSNLQRGATLYASRCADCHRADGLGDKENPPVWGDQSYNDGAGLASVDNLAAWLKVAMPLDEANLTEEQALDIAAYVNSHERPRFELNRHLPAQDRLGEYNAATSK
jgi:thiosulfate dehydrogenase